MLSSASGEVTLPYILTGKQWSPSQPSQTLPWATSILCLGCYMYLYIRTRHAYHLRLASMIHHVDHNISFYTYVIIRLYIYLMLYKLTHLHSVAWCMYVFYSVPCTWCTQSHRLIGDRLIDIIMWSRQKNNCIYICTQTIPESLQLCITSMSHTYTGVQRIESSLRHSEVDLNGLGNWNSVQ